VCVRACFSSWLCVARHCVCGCFVCGCLCVCVCVCMCMCKRMCGRWMVKGYVSEGVLNLYSCACSCVIFHVDG